MQKLKFSGKSERISLTVLMISIIVAGLLLVYIFIPRTSEHEKSRLPTLQKLYADVKPQPDEVYEFSVTISDGDELTRTSIAVNSYAMRWRVSRGMEFIMNLKDNHYFLYSPLDRKALPMDVKAVKTSIIQFLNTVRPIPLPEPDLLIELKSRKVEPEDLMPLKVRLFALREPTSAQMPSSIRIWTVTDEEQQRTHFLGYLQLQNFIRQCISRLKFTDDELKRIKYPNTTFLNFSVERQWAIAVKLLDTSTGQWMSIKIEEFKGTPDEIFKPDMDLIN